MKLKRGLVILSSLGLLSGCGLIPSQNESDEVKTELLEEDTKNSDLVKTKGFSILEKYAKLNFKNTEKIKDDLK